MEQARTKTALAMLPLNSGNAKPDIPEFPFCCFPRIICPHPNSIIAAAVKAQVLLATPFRSPLDAVSPRSSTCESGDVGCTHWLESQDRAIHGTVSKKPVIISWLGTMLGTILIHRVLGDHPTYLPPVGGSINVAGVSRSVSFIP